MTDSYARARRGIRSASPVGDNMGRTHDRPGHRGRQSRALIGEDRHWSRQRHNRPEVSLAPSHSLPFEGFQFASLYVPCHSKRL